MTGMRGALRWSWPGIVLGLLVLVPWGMHQNRARVVRRIVVVDKTVPFQNWLEHRSLFWLMEHLGVVRPDGVPYDPTSDYVGAHPPDKPGDPPERTSDLTDDRLRDADLLYFVDTYGVYEEDLESGERMEAALERSPKLFGGTTPAEAESAGEFVARGGTAIAEFNSLGSPTEAEARKAMEELFGVRWTHWIGRYFPHLEDRDEVPGWLRRVYEQEWKVAWSFEGPGYVLTRDDRFVEVLRVGEESGLIGLTIEIDAVRDPLLRGARTGVPYPYWFDVVEAGDGAEVLASFRWGLTPEGEQRLRVRGLPVRFPAVVRTSRPQPAGTTYYFGGDFADNPLREGRVPFAGYLRFRRFIEGAKLAPSEEAFFWRFYAPMMGTILAQAAGRP